MFLFLFLLGIELRASLMLGKPFASEPVPHPQQPIFLITSAKATKDLDYFDLVFMLSL